MAIDKQGHSAFAATNAEHEKNIADRQEERRSVTVARRAAVCGKPIAHSLSPVIHSAGFAAAGLLTWSYTAIECAEAELAELVAGLGPEWAGLSLTMPLKEVGLTLAATASPAATAVGAANTLVRRADGAWYADNTDVPGMVRVLTDAGIAERPSVTVLGGGGTARAALAAAAQLGAPSVTVVTRRPEACEELRPVAEPSASTWSAAPGRSASVRRRRGDLHRAEGRRRLAGRRP